MEVDLRCGWESLERRRVRLLYTPQAAGGQLPAQLPALRGLCGVESFVPSSVLNRLARPWPYPLRVTRPFLEPSGRPASLASPLSGTT